MLKKFCSLLMRNFLPDVNFTIVLCLICKISKIHFKCEVNPTFFLFAKPCWVKTKVKM